MDRDDGSDSVWDSSSDSTFGDSGRPMRREDFWGTMLFLALLATVISGLFSIHEWRYAIQGKTVAARVREVKLVATYPGQSRQHEMFAVAYSFPVEGGQSEDASDLLPSDWPVPGQTIDVRYIPGRRVLSRVAGHDNKTIVRVFLGSLAVLAGVILKFFLEAKASERRPARRYY